MVPRSSGFTLLELLVALAIFAVIGTVSFTALQSGTDTATRLRERRAFWQDLDAAFRILEQDLAMAIHRAPRIQGRTNQPALAGYGDRRRGRKGELLRLSRAGVTSIRQGAVSPYRRVAYRLRDGVLYRATWRRLDVPVRESPQQARLIGHIDEHSIAFWQDEAQAWIDQWPPPATGQADAQPGLPGAVRLRLEFANRGAFERVFLVGPPQPGEGDNGS